MEEIEAIEAMTGTETTTGMEIMTGIKGMMSVTRQENSESLQNRFTKVKY